MRIVGGLDVVLAGRPPRISGLVTRARRANRLVLVGRAGLKVDPLTTTWLLTGLGSGTRDTALSLLTRLQASPPLLTIGTSGAAVAAARQGLGVTQVHEEAVREQLDCGELASYAVTGTPLERPWQFCTTSEPTAATRLFLAHVCDPRRVGEAAFHIRHRPQGEYADV
jgi:DNA-binding transcriptional LysR family regulator